MVRQEKIGISNYFWSFPSEASVKVLLKSRKCLLTGVIMFYTSGRCHQAA